MFFGVGCVEGAGVFKFAVDIPHKGRMRREAKGESDMSFMR